MTFKVCIICRQTKPLTEFYKNSHCTTDGHEGRCKECRKRYQRELREKDPDGYRQKNREYERAHREQASARHLRWSRANAEHKAEYHRQWRKDNPDRMKDMRRIANARRRALIVNSNGDYTPQEWRALKERFGGKCLACGRFEPDVKITPDHVIPLALGGANSIDNIQPLCWGCNAAKRARVVDYR